jgi:S1-C subfamily serine protease
MVKWALPTFLLTISLIGFFYAGRATVENPTQDNQSQSDSTLHQKSISILKERISELETQLISAKKDDISLKENHEKILEINKGETLEKQTAMLEEMKSLKRKLNAVYLDLSMSRAASHLKLIREVRNSRAYAEQEKDLMSITDLALRQRYALIKMVPVTKLVNIQIDVGDAPGNLHLDKEEYEAIIRAELRRNGFTVIEAQDPNQAYIFVYLDLSEVIINEGINSSYAISLSSHLVDNIFNMRYIYTNSTVGFAGVNSDYPTSIRNKLASWGIKMTEAIAKQQEFNAQQQATLLSWGDSDLSPERIAALEAYKERNVKNGVTSGKAGDSSNKNAPTGDKEGEKEKLFSVTGTGFIISNRPLIVTNYHVINEAKSIQAIKEGEKEAIELVPAAIDRLNDIAILTTKSEGQFSNIVPLQIGSSKDVKIGDSVATYGFPLSGILGSGVKFSNGFINALTGLDDRVSLLQMSVPIQPGNSGGPLLDANGVVRGVVVSQLSQNWTFQHTGVLPQNVNFAIKADLVLELISKNQIEAFIEKEPIGRVAPPQQAVVLIQCER